VPDDRELVADGERGGEIEIARALGVAVRPNRYAGVLVRDEPVASLDIVEAEVIVERVVILGRKPLPAAADVDLPVVEL
jgi:ABC-type hemin transport system ATPase subunit